MKNFKFNSLCAVIIMSIFVLTSIIGCSSYRKTTTTSNQAAALSSGEKTSNEGTPETTTTTKDVIVTETKTESKPHGLVGGVFYLLGEIIAFPFKKYRS